MSQFPPRPDVQPAAGSLEAAGHGPKLMIIDDDPITVDLVRSQLASAGYHDFLVCTDPGRAMELVHAEEPDVVLLDIMMPAISGLEILRQVRASAASAHVPVIILTAAGDRETKVQALELGATDFLSKPVNFVELAPRVRNALVIKAHQDHLNRYAQELERQVEEQTAKLKDSYAALQRANET
ncbi:MAG TPA: response regulator, partial [Phycisphaerae bacterium]|nr:response regulator [Phycisphaerae bacterium]